LVVAVDDRRVVAVVCHGMHGILVVVVVVLDGFTVVVVRRTFVVVVEAAVVVVVSPGVDGDVNTMPVCAGSVACCTELPSRST
jgi:hypothetical protein